MFSPMLRINARSSTDPSSRQMRSSTSSMWLIPMRQGKHFPQDSYWQKAISVRVRSTAQASSSATMMPPEPKMAPALRKTSKSNSKSTLSAPRTPPNGPPDWTSLRALPPGTPPATSYSTSFRLMPKGTSTMPV